MYCWIKLICNLCHFSVYRTVRNLNVSANRNFSYWHRHWKMIINVCKRDWMVGIAHLVAHKRLGVHSVHMQTGRAKWKCPKVIQKNKKRKLRIEVIQSLSDHLLVLWGAHSSKTILCIRITHHMIFSLHTIFTLCLRTLTILSMLYLYRKIEREREIFALWICRAEPNPHTIMPKSTSPSGLENIVHWSNWYTLANAPTHDIHPQCTHLTVGTMCSLHTIHTFEFSLAPFAHRNPCVVHSVQHGTVQHQLLYSLNSYVCATWMELKNFSQTREWNACVVQSKKQYAHSKTYYQGRVSQYRNVQYTMCHENQRIQI